MLDFDGNGLMAGDRVAAVDDPNVGRHGWLTRAYYVTRARSGGHGARSSLISTSGDWVATVSWDGPPGPATTLPDLRLDEHGRLNVRKIEKPVKARAVA